MAVPILVIGASGNTGTEVIESLLAIGCTVRAADLNADKIRTRFESRVEAVAFDFHDRTTYPAALDGIQRMFLIRPPQISDVKRAILPFLEAAKVAGVKQVVFLSILNADRLKIVPHYSVEKMLLASGMDYVFLRSAYFMQNLSGIHAYEIRNRNEIFLPAGHGSLGMIDVRDVGEIAAKALHEGYRNEAYNLTGGEGLSFEQAAGQLTEVLQRPIRYANPGIVTFFRQMRKRGLASGLVTFMIIEYTFTKLGRSGMVTTDAERLLGRKPLSFRQFVNDYRDSW